MADVSTRRALVKAGVLVALIVIGTALWWLFGRQWIGEFSDLTTLRTTVARAGAWGPLLFVLGYAGITLLPIPKAPVSVAAGAAFGLIFGTALVYLGSLLGAALAFVIGRRLGREAVERLTGARVRKLDDWLTRSGLSAVIVVRLIPIVPFTLVNYGAALTAVRTRDYALGTAIGILPGTFGFVALGGGFATGRLTPVIVGITILVALSALAALLRPKKSAPSGTRNSEITPDSQPYYSWRPPMTTMSNPYDLVVIGGGTAGLVAAKTAARFGASVVLVELDRLGGDCLWTGCVPSKTLLAAARSDPPEDFEAVLTRVRSATQAIAPKDSVASVEESGATVIHGTARFTGPDCVQVDQVTVGFRRAVLATGAGPAMPPIPGLADVDYLTSDSVWSLATLPEQLTILGGGSIGCELGQAFARLGSQVTLIEAEDRVLPQEDPPASAIVLHALRADGADVRLGQPVKTVAPDSVTLADGRTVAHRQLLVALGRTPRTGELGLDAAEVATDRRGYVQVDSGLRTTNSRIWAAGDLTGHPQFTHVAGMHGSLAATNAVLGLRRSTKGLAIPRVTFTSPEVASVGVSPADAAAQHLRTTTVQHRDIDRAVTDDDVTGYTTLVSDRRGRIVGATIVGPRAGESLGEATLAVQERITTSTLASTVHAYPTFNDAIWDAAVADVGRQLSQPVIKAGITALAWVQRRRRP